VGGGQPCTPTTKYWPVTLALSCHVPPQSCLLTWVGQIRMRQAQATFFAVGIDRIHKTYTPGLKNLDQPYASHCPHPPGHLQELGHRPRLESGALLLLGLRGSVREGCLIGCAHLQAHLRLHVLMRWRSCASATQVSAILRPTPYSPYPCHPRNGLGNLQGAKGHHPHEAARLRSCPASLPATGWLQCSAPVSPSHPEPSRLAHLRVRLVRARPRAQHGRLGQRQAHARALGQAKLQARGVQQRACVVATRLCACGVLTHSLSSSPGPPASNTCTALPIPVSRGRDEQVGASLPCLPLPAPRGTSNTMPPITRRPTPCPHPLPSDAPGGLVWSG